MRWFKWRRSEKTPNALEWSVRRSLHGDGRLRDADAPRIEVAVRDGGVVELRGCVSTADMRDLAIRVARGVAGVTSVHSLLKTDAEITAELRDRLRSDARLQPLAADSVVFRGTAELRGTVTYDAQLAAIKLAGAIPGVRRVENYMQLATVRAAAPDPARAAAA